MQVSPAVGEAGLRLLTQDLLLGHRFGFDNGVGEDESRVQAVCSSHLPGLGMIVLRKFRQT